jgi:hypothetical protein
MRQEEEIAQLKKQLSDVLATYDIQREKCKLPLQLSGHVTPESHMKSREGEYPCSCSQNLLCQKASICLACSMERRK